VDVARGHGQTGGDDQALRALLTAEHLAPEEVRYQSAARVLTGHAGTDRNSSGRLPVGITQGTQVMGRFQDG
jgi:hypothetical protein